MNPLDYVKDVCRRARAASTALAAIDSEIKDRALVAMASKLRGNAARVLAANQEDLEKASRSGSKEAFLDRLRLTQQRIEQMATGLEEIAALRDPVGEVVSQWRRPGGLEVGQVRIPIGVVGIVFESRPNVTADAAGLCFKAGIIERSRLFGLLLTGQTPDAD